jgi:RND family efflux transporter MFP subunit
MTGFRERYQSWVGRLAGPFRLLGPVALLAVALVLGPGLIDRTREPAAETPATGAGGYGSAADAEWHDYAALEPAGTGPESHASGDAGVESEAGGPATLECIIEPNQVVAIGSPVVGRIESLHVERSDLVEAGQPLVDLDSSVEVAAVAVARARAQMDGQVLSREAAAELDARKENRANKLYERNVLSLDLKEEAETQAALAEFELQQAREVRRLASLELIQAHAMLKRRTIRSPVSGVVVDRLMSPGEVVDEETILRVAEIDPLRVEVILPSVMYGSIEPGDRAAITPDVPGDQVHVASVTIVDRVIDAASGTFAVRLELPNPDHTIPGGLHCQVRFLDE